MFSPRAAHTESGIHTRMRALMETLQRDFDFATFTWPGFLAWLAERLGKQVHCVPMPLHADDLFGSWISTPQVEYIFYDATALPVHQLHIQLHEIAHILCGHETVEIHEPVELATLMESLEQVRLRRTDRGEIEQEVEILTALIQESVFRHGRQAALTRFDFQNQDEVRLVQMMELG